MKERALYLLKYYLVTIVLFVVAKGVFMLACGGLSLDLSTALYFFGLPFLLTALSLWIRVPRYVYLIYNGLVAIAFALAFVADTSLYPFWHFKLDASCLQYLETPTEAMASVTTWYLVGRLFLLFIIVLLIWLLFSLLRTHFKPVRHRLLGTLGALLLVGPIIIGIRGGLGESTTNIGQVYFSQNQR